MSVIVRKLKRKLKRKDVIERCGLILKDGRVFATKNQHPTPEEGFKIPASALLEYEAELAGTWHTHPNQSAMLSQEDYRGFTQWPQLKHFIIGNDGVRAYVIDRGVVMESSLAIG